MPAKKGSALPVTLFNRVRQKLNSSLPIVRCTGITLIHLSHTLEELVLSRRIPALIFTGFQASTYWQEETTRYRELLPAARQVTIFGDASLPPESKAASLHITLSSEDLYQECFLVILSEAFSVILSGQEYQGDTADEATRQFDTLWSFEPRIVNSTLDLLEEVVAAYQPDRLSELQAGRIKYPPSPPDPALITEFTLKALHFQERLHQRYKETDTTWQQLQRYRDHLEDLVIERTAGLRAANQQLRREIAEREQAEAERERLLAAEREQRLLAETMQEVALVLTSQMSHTAVLDEILRQAQRIVPFKSANISLLVGNHLRIACRYGYPTLADEEFLAHLVQPVADFPLVQWVIESRLPLTISETHLDPRWVTIPQTAWIRSYISVPICLQDRVLGLLRLDSDIPGKFSPEDGYRLQPLANAAAIALENARLYTETQQRLKEQTALREAGAIIASTLGFSRVLNLIAEQMSQAIDTTSAYISIYNPDSSWTVLAEYYGPEASPQEKVSDLGMTYTIPEDDPTYLDCLRAGQVEILHQDDPNTPASIRNHLQQFNGQSVLLIPLRFSGELVAFTDLWESRRRREFTPDEIALCQGIAQQAAIAIEHARLYDETQKLYQQTQQQARQLEQILNTIVGGIILLDSDYRIKKANRAGQDYLLLLAGGEVGQTCTHLAGHPLAELLTAPPQGPYHEVTPEGLSRPIFEVYARPIVVGPEAEGWVIVVRDATEQREIQKRMQQQEKLAAVGQLAAGIAHDFNNILTSVIGFAELARYAPGVPVPVRDDLGHIVHQGQRAARLVRQILDFARKNIVTKRLVNLRELLENIVTLLERTIPESISLELTVESEEWGYTLNADPTQLQQALTNLAVNAADAMPRGGMLKFSLGRLTLTAAQPWPCPDMAPGDWLVLTVADTGTGMSPEVQKHLFEPFFTTKEVGQGTGLGLAQVEGIVKQHEGCIQVESQVGQGTTFTLYFPALSSPQAAVVPTRPPDKGKQRRQGKLILLAEDNVSVLKVMEAMLKDLGHQVLTATNGRRAFEIYEQHQDNISLVITDLTMPQMGGLALAEALHGKNQAVKILGITGYPLKVKAEDLLAQGIVGWLQKPLTLEQLTHQLERLL
jgi:signal transduction histidine kinase/CheY-like chemotaxis protein/DICT domain-containing protein